jgi:hypothetical protein
MNETTQINFSELPDDKLAMLWVDLNKPDSADQVELLKAEITQRIDEYVELADEACKQKPPDYDNALDKLEKARLLNDSPFISGKIKDVEKEQEERRKQSTDLSFDLENRLKQRDDMNKLYKAVQDAEKLDKEGLLPETLRDIFNKARREESESRETTGHATTKGRVGTMKESKAGYDFLLAVQEGKTNKSEVYDEIKGEYIGIKSDAFETLLKEIKHNWKKETETAINNFITDPKGVYLLNLNTDPLLVEASFYRHFWHNGVLVVHPECIKQLEELKDDIEKKSDIYRQAEKLYKESISTIDKVKAYEKLLQALEIFKFFPEKEAGKKKAGFRKRAQNSVFEGLKNDAAKANALIDKFNFNEYLESLKNIWGDSEKLTDLHSKDSTFLPGDKEMENYASRLETYQDKFEELERKFTGVKNNYERIESTLIIFEKNILVSGAQNKINAAEWWEKLNRFLEEESGLFGPTRKEKIYFNHFGARIDSLKKALIPLQSDQLQLEIMRSDKDKPDKWNDVLRTGEKLRKNYQEAADIYAQVFKKSNLVGLEASLGVDDFVTARKLLNVLYQYDKELRSDLVEQEQKVREAESVTTAAIVGFYNKANQLAASNKIPAIIESWKMYQHLILEFHSEGRSSEWPVLSGKCIYTAQSRSKIDEIVERLSKETKRVTEQTSEWIASKKIDSISEESPEGKKAAKGRISENDPEFIKAAEDIQLLRENNFLHSEQVNICKQVEFKRAKWLADQFIAKNNFIEAGNIWNRMGLAYPSDDNIEKEALLTKQNALIFKLTELLSKKDYQGAIDTINAAERENISIVAQGYQIRLKHALAFEGLKQFDNALRKLDDIKTDLLKLSVKDIEIIEGERQRLQIEHKIDQGIKKYQKACEKEKERYRNAPGFFNALLIHLYELKTLKEEYSKNKFINQYFLDQVNDNVREVRALITRNENTIRDEVKRDVFLYRLTLREFKTGFAANVPEDLIGINSDQQQIVEVCNFIEAEFDRVNPAENNGGFDRSEAERQAGSLNARDMAELMQRYYEQFNQLLKFESNLKQKTGSIKSKAGEAVYMFDKLTELYERADIETSWEYSLRNGYESRAWEAYFNGKTMTYGMTIPQIKKRLTYIQKYLNEVIVEIDEFNKKVADADMIKPEIEGQINQITNGYSAYLDLDEVMDWSVSQKAQEILSFRKAVKPLQIQFKYVQEEIYPIIIAFYNKTIAFSALDPNWGWKGFGECYSKAKDIEDNFLIWEQWSRDISPMILSNQKAHDLADWAGENEVTVPWQDQKKKSDVNAKDVILVRNWYAQVFSTNESWEVISPEEEKFNFKYKLDYPLPKTYQMWLWENAQTKNSETLETLKNGPKPDVNLDLENYPAHARAAQKVKSTRQDECIELGKKKSTIETKIAGFKEMRKSFPPLEVLDGWLRQKQYDRLRNAIDKGKEIGPQNKKEADYLRAREFDLKNNKKKSGGFFAWFK